MDEGKPRVSARARALAGAVDGVAELALAAALIAIPWRVSGFVLPSLGALAAVLGWSVAPLVAFGQTLGMRLFGLRMVGQDGGRPDPVEASFRELIGRGLLPASYLGVVGLGVVSDLLGRTEFRAGRYGLALVGVSLFGAVLSALGHLLVLVREDGRGLADLVGRTYVLPAVATPPADREALAAARRTRQVFWGVEVGLLALALGVPLVLGLRVDAHASQVYAERLTRNRAAQLFEANPADPELADQYLAFLERRGDLAAMERVRERHREAGVGAERTRELRLREGLAKNPHDSATVEALLELLLSQERRDDARAVRQAYFEANPSPRRRVTLAEWLRENGAAEEAVSQLRQAIREGADGPAARAYLGLALRDAGELAAAREELRAALAEEPEWDEIREALEGLDRPSGATGR